MDICVNTDHNLSHLNYQDIPMHHRNANVLVYISHFYTGTHNLGDMLIECILIRHYYLHSHLHHHTSISLEYTVLMGIWIYPHHM